MSLKDDLQEIDGVGQATAEKILAVVDENTNTNDMKAVERMLERGNVDAALSRIRD